MKINVPVALIAFLFAQTVSAQIILTSANMPVAGKIVERIDCDSAWTASQNIGTEGTNQTWDFGSAVSDGNTYQSIYLEPASTPWAADFSTATLANTDVVTDSSTFVFLKSTSTEFSTLGFKDPLSVLKYNPAQKLLKFPLKYQTTFNQSNSISGSSDGTPISGTQTDTVSVDAWGSVTTPLGTFQALRVKSIIEQDITLFIFNIKVNTVQYDWWTKDFVEPVFSYATSTTDFFGDVTTETSSNYLSSQSVGIKALQADETSLSILPNPANEATSIHFSLKKAEKVDFLVYSADGKLVHANRSVECLAGANQHSMDVSNLENGNYFIAVKTGSRFIGMKQLAVAR